MQKRGGWVGKKIKGYFYHLFLGVCFVHMNLGFEKDELDRRMILIVVKEKIGMEINKVRGVNKSKDEMEKW